MARDGLFALVCAGALCSGLCSLPCLLPAARGDDRESAVQTVLAVQSALEQGRTHLNAGRYQEAVTVLESQLGRINGNRLYLIALRDAYRGYVQQLRGAKRDAEYAEYAKRLRILEAGPPLDAPSMPTANAALASLTAAPPPAPKPAAEPVRPSAIRAVRAEEDPFSAGNTRPLKREGQALLERAEQEFSAKRYESAGRLFEQAERAEPGITAASRERWAYCKLCQVVEHLKRPCTDGPCLTDLEREVHQALSWAPKLDKAGKDVLRSIQERKAGGTSTEPVKPHEAPPPAAVRHLAQQANGWAVAETTNFRVLHKQPRELAERAAQVAERTRVAMQQKWFGAVEDWSPKCDIYLHASAHEYSAATKHSADLAGHSTFRTQGSKVLERRIDLHCDDPNLLVSVLPHEATHVVLAGKFGDQHVPRWADEGMAVLTEPRERIDRHLRSLAKHRQDNLVFSLRQLMLLGDYPEARRVGAFYAQSVSLVEFLSNEKGSQVFTQFLRDALRSNNYEAALKRHYGIQDFNDLELRWRKHAFGEVAVPGVAERGR